MDIQRCHVHVFDGIGHTERIPAGRIVQIRQVADNYRVAVGGPIASDIDILPVRVEAPDNNIAQAVGRIIGIAQHGRVGFVVSYDGIFGEQMQCIAIGTHPGLPQRIERGERCGPGKRI